MATIALYDVRKPDRRKQTLENPVWLASGVINFKESTGKGALLFSFPKNPIPDNLAPYGVYAPGADLGIWGQCYMIEDAMIEVMEAFTGGTPAIDLTTGTIATDAAKNGDNITYAAAGDLVANTAITEGTIGWYTTAAALRKQIINADTSVPVVFAILSAALTAGKCRVHLKISRVGSLR